MKTVRREPSPSSVGKTDPAALFEITQEGVARYTEEIARELSFLVKRHGLGTLGSLLEMAALEAAEIAEKIDQITSVL